MAGEDEQSETKRCANASNEHRPSKGLPKPMVQHGDKASAEEPQSNHHSERQYKAGCGYHAGESLIWLGNSFTRGRMKYMRPNISPAFAMLA